MTIILPYNGVYPKISPKAFIAENAVIIGDVTIGDDSSVWYNCVLRGDVNSITVGKGTNIQDGTIIHVHRKDGPTIIGDYVTIGHLALLHACKIEDKAFIGMGAKVIDYAIVESYGMVAAGALVTPNKKVLSKQVFSGVPAKFMRPLSQDEYDYVMISAENYIKLARQYRGA